MSDIEIFNLIKNQEFDKLYKLILSDKNIDFDVRDNNYNYFELRYLNLQPQIPGFP